MNNTAKRPTGSTTLDELITTVAAALRDVGLAETASNCDAVDIVATRDQVDFDNDIVPPAAWLEAFENAVNNSSEAVDKFPGFCEILSSKTFVAIAGE